MSQQTKVLALSQRLQRLVADLTPVRLGGQRRRLTEKPVGVEGCEELRVLEVLSTRTLRGDRLDQTRTRHLCFPSVPILLMMHATARTSRCAATGRNMDQSLFKSTVPWR